MDPSDYVLSMLLNELDKGRLSGETEGWLSFEEVFDERLSEAE